MQKFNLASVTVCTFPKKILMQFLEYPGALLAGNSQKSRGVSD